MRGVDYLLVRQDELYEEASKEYGAAIERLVRGYEADSGKQADLLQEIHIALWRSFELYQGRSSLRTWVYRVAHYTAVSYVIKQKRQGSGRLVSIEETETLPSPRDEARCVDDRIAIDRMLGLIHKLRPLDREVMLLYLEDLDAVSIGEITGISAGNVRNKIYRIKTLLAHRLHGGESA